MSNTNGDYISRADAIVQKCDCEAYDPKTGMIFECEAVPVERINAIPPADVWPREKVLQAIAVGLAKAGIPIGGRVHQCIYDALPNGDGGADYDKR